MSGRAPTRSATFRQTAGRHHPKFPPPTGISNRIAAALDGEPVDEVVDIAERRARLDCTAAPIRCQLAANDAGAGATSFLRLGRRHASLISAGLETCRVDRG